MIQVIQTETQYKNFGLRKNVTAKVVVRAIHREEETIVVKGKGRKTKSIIVEGATYLCLIDIARLSNYSAATIYKMVRETLSEDQVTFYRGKKYINVGSLEETCKKSNIVFSKLAV